MSDTSAFSLQNPIIIPGKLQEMLSQSSGGGTCGAKMYGGRKSGKSRGKKSCKSRGKKSCKSRGKK